MANLVTTKVSSNAQTAMPGIGDGQGCKVMTSTYTYTVAPATADVILSPLIQAGSVIADVIVSTTGLGTAGTYSIGYLSGATNLPAYFGATAAAVAGGVRRMDSGNPPPVLASNTNVTVTIGAAGANATGTVTITVLFAALNS